MKEPKFSYFGLQAYWGATKHYGGLKATEELIRLCHLSEGKYVLDVGCGVGITPCYIAKKYNCKVVGIDISEEMINLSKERAKRNGVENKVEFKVADAQKLPFNDGIFDIVIGESVLAFLEDKQKAIKECVRVLKPGGYIGFNEATWIKTPPRELIEYLSRVTGAKEILTSDGWKKLLADSGLKEIKARIYKVNKIKQFFDELLAIGFRDFLRGWCKFISQGIKSSAFRKYLKEYWPPKSAWKMFDYIGYGIYVGKK
jgi:ubiquinone/menaquinone biosynthesis C-methylase UbiE